MKRKLLELLVCPKCQGGLLPSTPASEEMIEGSLRCRICDREYPVTNGIPRFVPAENYAASFGYQWNLFRKEQLDTYNGTTLSADRLWSETGWEKEKLAGKLVLDVGCGAGRFMDAASRSGAEIVGVDISGAVDAAKENLRDRENLHFVQADIYALPFRQGTFDHCYCIGVIQHTPEPKRSVGSIASMIKPGGKIALTIYPRRPWTKLNAKYWLRPITKRVGKKTLLKTIQLSMPVLFPLTDVLFRLPILGKLFAFLIPVANYVNEEQLDREQRYAWTVLDTFDMLSPFYDQPMTEPEAMNALVEAGISARRSAARGLNLVGQRQ